MDSVSRKPADGKYNYPSIEYLAWRFNQLAGGHGKREFEAGLLHEIQPLSLNELDELDQAIEIDESKLIGDSDIRKRALYEIYQRKAMLITWEAVLASQNIEELKITFQKTWRRRYYDGILMAWIGQHRPPNIDEHPNHGYYQEFERFVSQYLDHS